MSINGFISHPEVQYAVKLMTTCRICNDSKNDDEFINAEITVKLQLVGNEMHFDVTKEVPKKQC